MADLPLSWTLHEKGQLIPDDMVLYQGINMPLSQVKALSAVNLIGGRGLGAIPQPDPNIMSSHIAQGLKVAEISSISSMCKESGLH